METDRAKRWRVRAVPALARHPTLQTAQFWDATCNVGVHCTMQCGGMHREHPSTGRTTPGPKAPQTRSGAGAAFLPVALDMNVQRSSEASRQERPLLTSSQVPPGDQASIWDSRHLQLKPDFEGKTRPVPLHPAASGEVVPNRRGFVPGEAPGYVTAGNSPLEGEATHI